MTSIVLLADVFATNGVIHVIDQVLIPQGAMEPKLDIVETLVDSQRFTTLLAAAKAAGVVDLLKGDEDLTLFAPTDAAFAMLPQSLINDLLLPQNRGELAAILAYHVVPGKNFSGDLTIPGFIPTLNGSSLFVSAGGRDVFIQNARLIKTRRGDLEWCDPRHRRGARSLMTRMT